MNIFRKEDGSISISNVVNALTFIAGLVAALLPIWQEVIPAIALPYVAMGLATLNVVIRLLSNGSPIQGSTDVKDKLGL